MRQSIPPHPTDGCERCTESTVCSAHKQYATKARPSASALLGTVQADAAAVHGRAFRALNPERTDHDAVPADRWRILLPWLH